LNAQRHKLEWVAPAPLWPTASVDSLSMRQPALLSFKSDQLVTELTQALAQNPPRLPLAEWESARIAPAGTPRLGSPPWTPSPGSPPLPLKLFQPVHGRFYMVAASFVCQEIGLPDHALKVASEERTYFVLRKLDADALTEMAWVPNPAFPADPTQYTWEPIQHHPKRLATNEELMPLFPVFVPKTATAPARRLHAGLIPTSSRDTRASAPTTASSSSPAAGTDPRVLEATARVVEPYGAIDSSQISSPTDPTVSLLIDASAFLILDLAEILAKYCPTVFAAIINSGAPAPTGKSGTLYGLLQTALADVTATPAVTWAAGLQAAWKAQAAIDAPGSPHSPLTSPAFNLKNHDTEILPDPIDGSVPSGNCLSVLLAGAILAENQPFDPPDAAVANQVVPKLDGNAFYIVRCVFQRCALKRLQFGALFPPILSDRSQPFAIASFFDSDAPARTIRIPMPFDTSPAALRRFPKGVGFLLSPKLQQQVGQVSKLADVVNGKIGNAPGLGIGEICCFSIPIITIVAMILLFMIAIALNLVFWWLPFLKICFPVPTAVIAAASGTQEE